MGGYYSNALFTISAVSASGGHCGIFSERDPRERSPCPVSLLFPKSDHVGGHHGARGAYSNMLSGFIHPSSEWDSSLDTYQYPAHRPPLWKRAWVVQERILSPRLLMFSKAQMSWLCRTVRFSECIPQGSLRKRNSSKEEREIQKALIGLREPSLPGIERHGTQQQLYDGWYDLVAQYTKCGLTVKSDIFPAISGIASTIARALPDDYFMAGLWKRDLHRGLLWSVVDSTKRMADLRSYRAPSWSWASLPGTCGFTCRQILLSDLDVGVLKISSVEMSVDERNPFGEVKSGILRVVGRLKRAHPAGQDDKERDPAFAILGKQSSGEDLYDLETQTPLGWYMADNQDRANISEIWCMPVLLSDWGTESQMWHCLAMVELPTGSINRTFMRVGMAWVKDPGWVDGIQEEAFSIF